MTPRLLLVTPVSPFSAQASGAQWRSWLYFLAMSRMGCVDVLVLSSQASDAPEGITQLRDGGVLVSSAQRGRALPALLTKALPLPLVDYALLVVRYASSFMTLSLPHGSRFIADLDDFSFRLSGPALRSPAMWKAWAAKWCIRQLVMPTLRRASGLVFAAGQDSFGIDGVPSLVLSNVCPEPPSLSECNPVPGHLLIVGSMWYPPNRDAVNWFLDKVWPVLKVRHAGLTLRIAGAAPKAQLARWAGRDGVSAEGFVVSLAEAYARAAVVLVPVLSGGGSTIKLLEALGHGRPCVVTSFAHQAFAATLRDGEHLRVADSAAAFVEQCYRLLAEPGLAEALGQRGRDQVCARFTPEKFIASATAFCQRAMT